MFLISFVSAFIIEGFRGEGYLIQNGNSMIPTLVEGTLINLTEPINLNEGDIIIFDYNSFFIKYENYAHRIIKIDEDKDGWYALTKGDNNWLKDFGKRRINNIKAKVEVINEM